MVLLLPVAQMEECAVKIIKAMTVISCYQRMLLQKLFLLIGHLLARLALWPYCQVINSSVHYFKIVMKLILKSP